jgi:hypothetical protein
MRFFVLCLLFAGTIFVGYANDPRAGELIRRDVPWGQAVNLADYGGTPMEVAVRSREMTFISIETADYTRMVPVVVNDYSIYGSNRVVMKPTRGSRRVEKKDGVAFPGSRSSMFLLYRDEPSGIEVFFLDETAGQNRDSLVIRRPARAAKDSALPPIDSPQPGNERRVAEEPPAMAPTAATRNDGYLSDELLDWYLRLQDARDALDLKDPKAVARFNEEAARYHEAVKKERGLGKR